MDFFNDSFDFVIFLGKNPLDLFFKLFEFLNGSYEFLKVCDCNFSDI